MAQAPVPGFCCGFVFVQGVCVCCGLCVLYVCCINISAKTNNHNNNNNNNNNNNHIYNRRPESCPRHAPRPAFESASGSGRRRSARWRLRGMQGASQAEAYCACECACIRVRVCIRQSSFNQCDQSRSIVEGKGRVGYTRTDPALKQSTGCTQRAQPRHADSPCQWQIH